MDYTLNRYHGTETDLLIPAAIDGVRVRHLAAGAFEGASFERVEISQGVDCLRDRTFADCAQLRKIVIPPSVIWFFDNPFEGTSGFVIVCKERSEAHKYAVRKGYAFEFSDQWN